MRVLHVIPSMESEDGGPAIALDGMARGLAAQGVSVTVATTARTKRRTSSQLVPGVDVLRFPRTLPGAWKYSRPLGAWLRDNAAAFDAIHVHALFSYATIPACRAAMANHVPLVLRPLGTLDEWCLARRSWKKRPYLRFVERRHLDGASVIHVTSELERGSVSALGYGAKARVIPLGVDQVATAAHVREVRGRGVGAESLNILFLSRLDEKKGLPLLISALGRLHPHTSFTCRVAGSGPARFTETLRRMCLHVGITERVMFLGHVTGTGKKELLDWADVFVLPSYQENFSLAAVEAMAAGVPVVLSENVGVASDAASAGAGLVVRTDVSDLADAIRRLAEDGDLRLRMGLAGRQLVADKFTWTAACASIVKLYEELRSEAAAPAAAALG